MNIKNSRIAPASSLLGVTLDGGWQVTSELSRPEGSSGGRFSHHYIVEREGQRAFLKALDFSEAFEPGVDTIKFLSDFTSAFEHERDVLIHCKERRFSKVVVAIDHGHVQVPGIEGMNGRVFYLIFELADGDVRCQVDRTNRFDPLWSMQAIKDVCLGLYQVHGAMIAHQDTKPSNVLIFKREGFRIADFGRSSRRGRSVWYDNRPIAGDRNYSPPELLYGFTHPDFAARRIGCDLYMLGNLISFMFTGVNVTAALMASLDKQFHWRLWHGTYDQVLPQVNEAFTRVLEALEPQIPEQVRAHIIQIIRELCNPDLSKRGHPKSIGGYSQYSLERYVSKLDLLYKRLALTQRMLKKTG